MANGFGAMVFTDYGRNLLAKAQTGVQLKFTRIAVGDGMLNGQDATKFKHLLDEVLSLNIAGLIFSGSGQAVIESILSNDSLSEGFYWREIGVFATDPQLGEILYGYVNANDGEIFIPDKTTNVYSSRLNLNIYIANASNVTAMIDKSLAYATKQDIDDIKNGLIVVAMADKVSNPLTFTGGSAASFDGSSPVTVTIPSKPEDVNAAPQSHTTDENVHITTLACSKAGTVYALTGLSAPSGRVSCIFSATAAYAAGDTVTIDKDTNTSTPYTLKTTDGTVLTSGAWAAGAIVQAIADVDNKVLYVAPSVPIGSVTGATLGGNNVARNSQTLQFPAYPTNLPANGGTATYAHYPSHAVGLADFGLRGNYISSASPSGGNDGDTWDQV